MKIRIALAVVLTLALALPVLAQHPEGERREGERRAAEPGPNRPRANQGRIPDPPPRRERNVKPEPERIPGGRVNSVPHVANDHWYGHDKVNDRRFHLDHPFEHGRFERFGPSYRYSVERFDLEHHRFWFPGGFFFEVASWDWALAADWCWTCGEDFVVYNDDDHPGWYLLYNIHTGGYVHVQYMGS